MLPQHEWMGHLVVEGLASYQAAAANRGDGEWTIDEAFNLVAGLVEKLRRISNGSLPVRAENHWARFVTAHRAAANSLNQTTLKKRKESKSKRAEKHSVTKKSASRVNERLAAAAEKALALQLWFKQACVRRRRLLIYLDSCSAVLDGVVYKNFDREALQVLKVLAENKNKTFPATELYQRAFGKPGHQKTLIRILNRLCKPFRRLVHGRAGQGYSLKLPLRAP